MKPLQVATCLVGSVHELHNCTNMLTLELTVYVCVQVYLESDFMCASMLRLAPSVCSLMI